MSEQEKNRINEEDLKNAAGGQLIPGSAGAAAKKTVRLPGSRITHRTPFAWIKTKKKARQRYSESDEA